MTHITIEAFAIDLLDKLGYEYIYAPDIAPDGENPERDSYAQVLLLSRLQRAVSSKKNQPHHSGGYTGRSYQRNSANYIT